jgi:hypothetical protein
MAMSITGPSQVSMSSASEANVTRRAATGAGGLRRLTVAVAVALATARWLVLARDGAPDALVGLHG